MVARSHQPRTTRLQEGPLALWWSPGKTVSLATEAIQRKYHSVIKPYGSTHSFGLASRGGGSFVGDSRTAALGRALLPSALPFISPFTPWPGGMPLVSLSAAELN